MSTMDDRNAIIARILATPMPRREALRLIAAALTLPALSGLPRQAAAGGVPPRHVSPQDSTFSVSSYLTIQAPDTFTDDTGTLFNQASVDRRLNQNFSRGRAQARSTIQESLLREHEVRTYAYASASKSKNSQSDADALANFTDTLQVVATDAAFTGPVLLEFSLEIRGKREDRGAPELGLYATSGIISQVNVGSNSGNGSGFLTYQDFTNATADQIRTPQTFILSLPVGDTISLSGSQHANVGAQSGLTGPSISALSDITTILHIDVLTPGATITSDSGVGYVRPDLSILSFSPKVGGDIGFASLALYGNGGITENTSIKLTRAGQPDIVGSAVRLEYEGRTGSTTFDLKGQARGTWDVVVMRPDGQSKVFPGAFTIEAGREAQIATNIVGPTSTGPAHVATYTAFIENRGNVDAYAVPVWIGGIPKTAQWQLINSVSALPEVPGQVPTDLSQVPIQLELDNQIVLLLLMPVVTLAASGIIQFNLQVHDFTNFQLEVGAGGPLLPSDLSPPPPSDPASNDPSDDCRDKIVKLVVKTLLDELFKILPGADCIKTGSKFLANLLLKVSDEVGNGKNTGNVSSAAQLVVSTAKVITACAGDLFAPEVKIFIGLLSDINKLTDVGKTIEACFRGPSPKTYPVRTAFSSDPNAKVGSEGWGDAHYVTGQELLPYSVYFENEATATAPAQVVVVRDRLNPALVDLSTFSFGPITFGDVQVVPPSGLSAYTTEVDLRLQTDVIVKIDAQLDKDTGEVTWRFTSTDPFTDQLPDDPLVGFLPPNLSAPEGQGAVVYTVMPRAGLATGTQIQNRAVVVFDANAPLDTNKWLNTIDNDKPVSQVNALAATQNTLTFAVSWKGQDVGSGLRDFTIYVSDNGGSYTAWLTNTTDTSATFTGAAGHAYAFYSQARDNVYNLEDAHAQPDAATTISTSAGVVDVSGQIIIKRGVFRFNRTTGRFVQTLTLTNTGVSAITGPVSLVLDSLSSNAALFNKTGTTSVTTPAGSPFLTVQAGDMAAGTSVTVTLEFTNSNNKSITYNNRVLSGPGSR